MGSALYSLMVGRDHAVPVEPLGGSATVTVDQTGGTVYYADNQQVSASNNQGSIAPGGSASFTSPMWLIASALAGVRVQVSPVSGASGGSYLPLPTGLTNGQDTAPLNAVLVAGGTIRPNPLVVAPVYSINAPLVVPSNTDVDFGAATFNLVAGTGGNMLQNTAVTPTRTFTDAVTTAGSNVITSATANFNTNVTVGQQVAVVQAGPTIGGNTNWLYGQVQAITSNTQITIQASNSPTSQTIVASASVNGGTLYIFPRDQNIKIRGGIWNAGSNRGIGNWTTSIMRIRRCDGGYVKDTAATGTGMGAGTGGFYQIDPGDVTGMQFLNNVGNGVGSVVSGNGPMQYCTIDGMSGTTQDDEWALGTINAPSWDTEGDIIGCSVRNAFSTANSYSAGRVFSVPSTAAAAPQYMTPRAFYGMKIELQEGLGGQGLRLTNAGYFDGEINGVAVTPSGNWPTLTLEGIGAVSFGGQGVAETPSHIQIRNVSQSPNSLQQHGLINIDAPLQSPITQTGLTIITQRHVDALDYISTAAGVYHLDGPKVPIDVSQILAPQDGCQAINSNGSLGCGIGPVVFSATQGTWKHLNSGATYTLKAWPPVGGSWVGVVGSSGYILFGQANAVGDFAPPTGDVVSLPAGMSYSTTGSDTRTAAALVASPPSWYLKNPANTQGAAAVTAAASTLKVTLTMASGPAFSGMISVYSWDPTGARAQTLTDGISVFGMPYATFGPSANGIWSRFYSYIPGGSSISFFAQQCTIVDTNGVGLGGIFFN